MHAGAGLEMRCADGSWLTGVYEWSFDIDEPPVLRVEGLWGAVAVPISAEAVLRWPARSFGRH